MTELDLQNDVVEDEVADYIIPVAQCPADRPEAIHNIVETVDRYNPDNLPLLEDYVREQMLNNTIDKTANLAVLKLYQFNPEVTNTSIIISILALALASLPDPDFNLSLCMLNEETMELPGVIRLLNMQNLLESCQFKQFWEIIRKFISATLAATYQTISLQLLQECLNLEGEDLADWVKLIDCTVNAEDASLIDFPQTKENQTKPTIVQESVKFEQLTKIIGVGRLTA
ncbi:hypothetical protein HDU76_013644 [Blyttiomyces sp. JEL0837]|nr:hypothetical protein HDU76_013644 [Blyttiomyces sp. JEL0837]